MFFNSDWNPKMNFSVLIVPMDLNRNIQWPCIVLSCMGRWKNKCSFTLSKRTKLMTWSTKVVASILNWGRTTRMMGRKSTKLQRFSRERRVRIIYLREVVFLGRTRQHKNSAIYQILFEKLLTFLGLLLLLLLLKTILSSLCFVCRSAVVYVMNVFSLTSKICSSELVALHL